MKILLLWLYIVIACPVYVGILLLFPILKILDLRTKEIRWLLTVKIYMREEDRFKKACWEAAKKGIYIDFPPEHPTSAKTWLELLRYAIGIPINENAHLLFLDDDDDDF